MLCHYAVSCLEFGSNYHWMEVCWLCKTLSSSAIHWWSVSLPQAVWPSASLSLVLGRYPNINPKQLFFKESLWLPVLLQSCRPRHLSISTGCLPFWPGLSTTGSCSPWFTTTPDPSLQGCYPGTVPPSHDYSLLGEGKCDCVRMHMAAAGANLPKFMTVW